MDSQSPFEEPVMDEYDDGPPRWLAIFVVVALVLFIITMVYVQVRRG